MKLVISKVNDNLYTIEEQKTTTFHGVFDIMRKEKTSKELNYIYTFTNSETNKSVRVFTEKNIDFISSEQRSINVDAYRFQFQYKVVE